MEVWGSPGGPCLHYQNQVDSKRQNLTTTNSHSFRALREGALFTICVLPRIFYCKFYAAAYRLQ